MAKMTADKDDGRQFSRRAVAPNLPAATVATMPPAANHPGALMYCSNGAAGSPCLVYSNGTNWLRVLIGAAVATS
jgi:hypothetical protein